MNDGEVISAEEKQLRPKSQGGAGIRPMLLAVGIAALTLPHSVDAQAGLPSSTICRVRAGVRLRLFPVFVSS